MKPRRVANLDEPGGCPASWTPRGLVELELPLQWCWFNYCDEATYRVEHDPTIRLAGVAPANGDRPLDPEALRQGGRQPEARARRPRASRNHLREDVLVPVADVDLRTAREHWIGEAHRLAAELDAARGRRTFQVCPE